MFLTSTNPKGDIASPLPSPKLHVFSKGILVDTVEAKLVDANETNCPISVIKAAEAHNVRVSEPPASHSGTGQG